MKILISIILIFINSIVYSQNVFEKKQDENSQDFIKRVFPKIEFTQIIAGNWGDTTARYKIIGFYLDTIQESSNAILLQSISKSKFIQLKFDHQFGVGYAPYADSNIESVFFFDTDGNGIRELIIIESGLGQCYTEIEDEEQDEDGNAKIVKKEVKVACRICEFMGFEQKVKSNSIEDVDLNENGIELREEECNAENVKKILQQRKKK